MDKYFLCNQLEEGISIDSLIQNGDTSAILVSGRREGNFLTAERWAADCTKLLQAIPNVNRRYWKQLKKHWSSYRRLG